MKLRLFSLMAVFAVFTVYTAFVVADHGYMGFMVLAETGGWATQVSIDLCIALTAFAFWMFRDARGRGIPAWPYLVAILAAGSIGALAYLIHRTLRETSATQARRAATT